MSSASEMAEKTKTTQNEDIIALARANNSLAVSLHRILAEEKQNVFFSPFSVSTAMAMLLCAAEGKTASEMCSVLGYDDAGIKKDDVASIFEEQMSLLLQTPDSYTLSCSNAMLNQKGFNVKEEFKKILFESFKALHMEIDFMQENQKAVDLINGWVKEKTNDMIPKIVQSLDRNTVLILINAIYFKGTWMQKFDKKRTHPQIFYNKGIEDNGKEVDMMKMKEKFPFYEDSILQALQLPYIGEEVAMLILLPRERDGLESLEKNLCPSFVQDLKIKLRKRDVIISLPRFRLEYTKSLVPVFKELGMKHVFSRGAELGIASDSPDLAVSEILHKAVLEVNEEGSEAAAATMVAVMMCALIIEPEFVADHPFAFVIYNTKSDLILFMGRVNEL